MSLPVTAWMMLALVTVQQITMAAVTQVVEGVVHLPAFSGSIPDSSSPHPEMFLGKTINHKLPLLFPQLMNGGFDLSIQLETGSIKVHLAVFTIKTLT